MTAADGYVTDVSYTPGFYPNMAPVAMRYVAALNRVVPPQTANGFRYLELGCGLGCRHRRQPQPHSLNPERHHRRETFKRSRHHSRLWAPAKRSGEV